MNDLGPFADIVELREQPDGSYDAFAADGSYLLALDAEGFKQVAAIEGIRIKAIVGKDGLRMEFNKTREKAEPVSFAVPFGTTSMNFLEPVRFLVDHPVFTKRGTAPTEIEGHVLRVGDRLLLTSQPDPAQNGIYTVAQQDYAFGTWVMVDTPTEGTTVLVAEGTHTDTLWVLTGHSGEWQVLQVAGSGYTGATITMSESDAEPEPAPNHPDDIDDLLNLLME